MYQPKIKICGLRSALDMQVVTEAGADFAGFIFYSQSKRYNSPKNLQKQFQKINETKKKQSILKKVGVFVNESLEQILAICEILKIDIVQLHGDRKKEDYLEQIPLPVWRSIPIDEETSESEIKDYFNLPADKFLLDYKSSDYGGSGKSFPWEKLSNIPKEKCILAGGICIDNIIEAIKQNTWGLDINSGVESRTGIKDYNKIREIIKKIKNYG